MKPKCRDSGVFEKGGCHEAKRFSHFTLMTNHPKGIVLSAQVPTICRTSKKLGSSCAASSLLHSSNRLMSSKQSRSV